MRDREVLEAARNVGLQRNWIDAFGRRRQAGLPTLRALLDTLQIAQADDALASGLIAPLLIVDARRPLLKLPAACRHARRACIDLEFGGRRECDVIPARDGMRLSTALPPGYHSIEIGGAHAQVAAAPPRCYTLADALKETRPRAWGLAVQLYALSRPHDLGFGDFTALSGLARSAGRAGASALAISPAHALLGAEAGVYRPYSPSNRSQLNALHADPFPEGDAAGDSPASIAPARRQDLIDWPRGAAAHRKLSERAFRRFVAGKLGDAASFQAFRAEGGIALTRHACYEAIDEDLRAHGHDGAWPAKLRDPDASGARALLRARADRVAFHAFLQWRAACGLAAAQRAARDSGMAVGLVADLAVGVDPRGSECWSLPHEMLLGAAIGAPPDPLNALGQNWGLTTFSPHRLERNGFAPFLEVLRASMRHAGGVRIDHVMGLSRLWLVPGGAAATDGAYLSYPFADLLRLVALESRRHRCIVIGEDLGTVPAQCRRQLARAGVLGLDVLAFMRDGAAFMPPARWRDSAVAMTSTHDVAPIAGWWQSRDLDWRSRLQLFGEVDEAAERSARERARSELVRMFRQSGVAKVSERAPPARIVDAAVTAVAKTPSPLALVPLEDLLGRDEQPNLPGTVDTHPNWRRRYRADAATMLAREPAARRVRRLVRGRR